MTVEEKMVKSLAYDFPSLANCFKISNDLAAKVFFPSKYK